MPKYWPSDKYPGTDYETFNWEWLIRKMRKLWDIWDDIKLKYSETVQNAAAAADSAEAAADSAEAAAGSAGDAADSATQLSGALYYVTPEMYGAVGDGTTDDTTAIQAAFTAAIADNKPVYMRNRYKITSALNVSGTIDIRGCGRGHITQASANTPVIQALTGADDVIISGLAFHGYGYDYVNSNVTSDNVASAIYIKQAVGAPAGSVKVLKCTFDNFGFACVNTVRVATVVVAMCNMQLLDIASGGNYNFGLRILEGVTNCVINKNEITGGASAISIGSTSRPVQNIKITENLIHDIPGQHGMYLQQGEHVLIDSNILYNINLQPIKCQIDDQTAAMNDIIISNNIAKTDSTWAINCNLGAVTPGFRSSDIIITGNETEGGINVEYCDSLLIAGNKINEAIQIGMLTRFCSGVTVVNNCVYNTQREGIVINCGTAATVYNVHVMNNVIKGWGLEGTAASDVALQVYYAGAAYIKGNNIEGNGNRIGLFLFNGQTPNSYLVGNTGTGCTYSIRFEQNAEIPQYDANYFDTQLNSPYAA